MVIVSLAIPFIFPSSAEEVNGIHCDYVEIIDGFQCSDSNEWYAPGRVVTQDMIDYYAIFGLQQPNPDVNPESFTVIGSETETYS